MLDAATMRAIDMYMLSRGQSSGKNFCLVSYIHEASFAYVALDFFVVKQKRNWNMCTNWPRLRHPLEPHHQTCIFTARVPLPCGSVSVLCLPAWVTSCSPVSRQLEDVDRSLAKLEAAASLLDSYSKQLENRCRALGSRWTQCGAACSDVRVQMFNDWTRRDTGCFGTLWGFVDFGGKFVSVECAVIPTSKKALFVPSSL